MNPDVHRRTTCRMCDGRELEQVLELTPTPPGNHFLRKAEIGRDEPRYPLELDFCGSCHHVQLAHVVDPRILYQRQYSYVSGTSSVFVKHLADFAADMAARFSLPAASLVADIGSNDGTCLRFFRDAGHRVVGVDPATEIAERATAGGILTVADFFGEELARRLRAEHGPAQLITSHNACAHIDDLAGVVRGVEHWLADDGLFSVEVGYFLDVYQNVWFDTIYHEHLDYHTVAPFDRLFARAGMEVISVDRVAPQGGSIRVIARKRGAGRPRDASVDRLIALERDAGLDRAETVRRFGERIQRCKAELSSIIRALRAQGRSVAGFGAPTKATTLLHHFELGDVLDFIVDENPLKQGMFSPGHHIPVLPATAIYERRPDYLLILAWNFAESIMANHARYAGAGGRFIVPMPAAHVV